MLIHYSAYAPKLATVLDMPGRRILLSHNVTPARWFWAHDAQIAVQCSLGRKQMHDFAARCDVVVGDSLFNAAELGSDRVLPLVLPWIDAARGAAARAATAAAGRAVRRAPGPAQAPGRADPGDRAAAPPPPRPTRGWCSSASRCTSATPRRWRRSPSSWRPAAWSSSAGSTTPRSRRATRSAHAFLCLSEHEGFCVPLLEAFQHGVPVVARPRGAVTETVGDAALLLDGSLDAMAELVHFAITDAELRATLRERGRARLEAFSFARTSALLRELLEG